MFQKVQEERKTGEQVVDSNIITWHKFYLNINLNTEIYIYF